MHLSPAGLAFLMAQEGFRATAYPDPATGGYPFTIGYGSTTWRGRSVEPEQACTQEEAEVQLARDVRQLAGALDAAITVALEQHQVDALLVFVYNVGVRAFQRSTLLTKLNAGDLAGAAAQFLRWNRGGGRVLPGLVARREREQRLFLEGVYV